MGSQARETAGGLNAFETTTLTAIKSARHSGPIEPNGTQWDLMGPQNPQQKSKHYSALRTACYTTTRESFWLLPHRGEPLNHTLHIYRPESLHAMSQIETVVRGTSPHHARSTGARAQEL